MIENAHRAVQRLEDRQIDENIGNGDVEMEFDLHPPPLTGLRGT